MLATGVQAPQAPSPITREKLLVVEEPDARRFFIAALSHLGMSNAVQVHNAGGHGQWSASIRTLLITPGFEMVRSLALIRDAEGSARSAFQATRGILRQAGLVVPTKPNTQAPGTPNVWVFILPDCASRGMLETLCLAAVAGDPVMHCVERFMDCVRQHASAPPRNEDKARLHAFLASRTRPDLRLAEAAEKGHWPWDAPAFEALMHFLADF